MELKEFSAGRVTVFLYPEDCARLAKICREVDDAYCGLEHAEMRNASRTYATAFAAMAPASIAFGNMLQPQQAFFLTELRAMGLPDLVTDPAPEGEIAKLQGESILMGRYVAEDGRGEP